jgi:octaheme c-type cytochrome (tetrathionate reductase family)
MIELIRKISVFIFIAGVMPISASPCQAANTWTAPDQEAAKERAKETVPFVSEYKDEGHTERKMRLLDQGLSLSDIHDVYFLLDSPIIKKREDHYSPVRFAHKRHAALIQDCTRCHHYRPKKDDALETTRCSACHQDAFNSEHPERIGLKAAYHQQCMECHKAEAKGPTTCTGCHLKNVPDHTKLVNLPDNADPFQVTAECLRCHETQGKDMIKTAHWLWKGPSPYTTGHSKEILHGKAATALNNYCINVISNEPRCTSCHAGFGWKDASFDFTDMSKIDCLVCHDTTGTYKKEPTAAGMPKKDVDLKRVAQKVGHSSRATCGACHFNGGGGDAIKHADMSRQLLTPERSCDVHMGGYDFACTECHKTRNHRIAGRSTSVPVAEGKVSCQDCHGENPHYSGGLLDHHLNNHCKTLECNVCHSPVFAKCKPTKTYWDWSQAGDKNRKPQMDKYGKPDYNWKKGFFKWEESAVPDYRWYSGYMHRVLLGDKVDTNAEVINLTTPVGSIKDPSSKITPFKIMKGIQAVDADHDTVLVPHLFPRSKEDKTAFWKNRDWDKAFKKGMSVAGLPYSGSYKWKKTWMYWRLEHEVMPADMALSCAQCHESLKGETTCNRCHQDNRNVDFKSIAHKGTDFSYMKSKGRDVEHLINKTDYINFKSLGYKGDPIIHGGRFKQRPMGYGTTP